MIKQTWNVSDEERKRILFLHESATKNLYLLNEQTSPSRGGKMVDPGQSAKTETTTFPETNIGNNFRMGEYQSDLVKQQISNLRPSIDEFIKNSDSRKFNINITAGESQIKNPKQFEQKGSLALARANSVKRYFEEIYKDLIDKGILTITSPIDVDHVVMGQTEYKANSADPQNKNYQFYLDHKKDYDNEQFVRFTLKGEGTKEKPAIPPSYICDFNAVNSGGVASKENNFLYTATTMDISAMPNGTVFRVSINPAEVPDLLICSTESETQTTGFVGAPSWSIQLATILGNAFGNNVPEPLPSNIVPIDTEKMLDYYGQNLKAKNFQDWFQHSLTDVDFNKKNPRDIIKQIKWWVFSGNSPIDSKSSPNEPEWQGRYGKTLFFTKKPEDKSLTIRVYSPIGTTIWRIKGACEGT